MPIQEIPFHPKRRTDDYKEPYQTDTPHKVAVFLRSHGWTQSGTYWQTFQYEDANSFHTWTEALAYEMFEGIVCLGWSKDGKDQESS